MSVTNSIGKWTKWWWLGCFGLYTWTFEERRVRLALGMTAMVAFLIIHFPLATILQLIGIKPHYAAILSGLVSVVLALFAARPIAGILFPYALRQADKNSQRRLRGRAAHSATLRFGSPVLTFALAGPAVGLAALFVLSVPFLPVALSLDTQVRQRAVDEVWMSATGHFRRSAGRFPLVDNRISAGSTDGSLSETARGH
jgi:hypothetical protein